MTRPSSFENACSQEGEPNAIPSLTRPFISSLPEELLIAISEHLKSVKDRLAFIKTCRAFYGPGCRTLYARIQVRGDFDSIFVTFIHRPDLAKHIRSYSGPLYIGFPVQYLVGSSKTNLVNGAVAKLVQDEDPQEGYFPLIFQHAMGITELEVTCFYHLGYGFGEETLGLMCQMPLKKLAVRCDAFERLPKLARLLSAQRGIRTLELHGGKLCGLELHSLTQDDLPNLESLACSAGLAKVLVPGRPIKSVMLQLNRSNEGDEVGEWHTSGSLKDGREGDKELWLKLAQSTETIVKLGLAPITYDYLQLELTGGCLPGIRELCLKAERYDILELAIIVSYFPELCILDIGGVGDRLLESTGPPVLAYGSVCVWGRDSWIPFMMSETLRVVNVQGCGSYWAPRRTTPAIEKDI